MSGSSSSPSSPPAQAGPDRGRVLSALGLPVPPDGGGLPLARLDGGAGRPLTVAAALTAEALAVAAQRGTPLLVVAGPPARPADAGSAADAWSAVGTGTAVGTGKAVGTGPGAVPVLGGPPAIWGGAGATGNHGGPAVGARPWPVVVVAGSPWALAGADLGLLVGERGPADHDGLDEESAADLVRRFLALCLDAPAGPPSAADGATTGHEAAAAAARGPVGRSLTDLVPFAIDGSYDPGAVLAAVVDGGRWVELAVGAAPEVLTVVARIGGRSVGVTVSCPGRDGGRLTPAGCARVERLLDWCERGGRPWVSLVDSAGIALAAGGGEAGSAVPADAYGQATLRRAAARARAAEVTKLVVVVGRAVGLAATVLGAVGARADLVLPWPRAQLSLAPPPPGVDPAEAARLAAADRAATEGDLLDVIHPDETRARLIELLDLVRGRREYGPATVEAR